MKNQNYNVIGVMSGTSLDGVDLAHISFSINNDKWSYTINESETIPYSKIWIERLKNGINLSKNKLDELNNVIILAISKV